MKGFARKNQLIITGLAVMIAVAGYLHFTSEGGTQLSETETETASTETEWIEEDAQAELLSDDEDSVETMAELTDDAEESASTEDADDEYADISTEEDADDEYADISAEEVGDETDEAVADTEDAAETGSIGEAVLVNNTITEDYFSSAKLSREQARAKNEETLMEIVNNTKMEDEMKQEAVNDLIRLTEISEMETAAETLLGAKGFENAIVTITEDSADVVVDAEGLTKQQIVQIQDIVKRKTKISVENIVITPVGVEE